MIFTALNAKQLSLQIDNFRAAHPRLDFHFNYGREGSRSRWWAHDRFGAALKTGLSFGELVAYANERADLYQDCALPQDF
jgi:hypothetical protein